MKKLLLLLVVLATTTLFAQEEKGVLKFENETIDYGDITQNSDGNHTFIVTNVGKAPIIINKVKGSCQCTVVNKPTDPILPGETAEIGVNYSTTKIGRFSKTVTVFSNANEKTKTLRIKGNVIKEKTSI